MDRPSDDVKPVAVTPSALLDRERAKLETARRELALKETLLAQLPADLPVPLKMVHAQGYKCDAGLRFESPRREDVVALLQALPPVDVVFLRGSTSSFVPRTRFDGVLRDGQRVEPVAPLLVQVDHFAAQHAPNESFEWWTQVGEHLVKVALVPGFRQSFGMSVFAQHPVDHRGHVTAYHWQFRGLPGADHWITWGRTEPRVAGHITLYWAADRPWAEVIASLSASTERLRQGRV